MKKVFATLSLLAMSATPAFAVATIQVTDPEASNPLITDIGTIFAPAANLAIIIAAIMVFFYLLWGGISWLTSGGDKTKTEEAQKRITAAVIGLAIVASAWAIMNIIDTFFGIGLFGGSGVTLPSIRPATP
jgi:hypothetical protein